MPGEVAHYQLLDRIGEGGMGVVYQARDRRLGRLVALKFLSNTLEVSADDVERFLHEARAISQLNHPNIATIYAVEEADGERFLAFEYLPGGTLRSRIRELSRRGDRLGWKTIFSWSIRIARALAHAHRHGIIHRDIKTDNVLLTAEDNVKLTDFGVAQVAGERSSDFETAGTAAYMSPEQAQGLPIDQRSDIFSFGVVLYEMVCGAPPFSDPQPEALLYDIVNTTPEPLASCRRDAPPELQEVIDKALAKDPADRYLRMDELIEDLEQASETLRLKRTGGAGAVASPPEPAIAVLPFVDMSPERDQEYFCDGMTEELIQALSELRGLKTVSRTSSFQFKGKAYDVREIGAKLGVQAVLEGSVRKAGPKLRITVQLIKVSDGYHLWSERFDRELSDVFAVQDEIAQCVAEKFRLRLERREQEESSAGPRKPTEDLQAYNLYLAGRYLLNQRSPESLQQARARFAEAIARDERFAQAHAGLAEVLILRSGHPAEVSAACLREASAAAAKAVSLDPSSAEARVALGLTALRADWDFERAGKEFELALDLQESYATGHHQYAMYLSFIGRIDVALDHIRRAQELDPLSLIISTAVGRILHFAKRYDEAIAQCRRTIELNANFVQAYFDLAMATATAGLFDQTKAAIEKIESLSPDPMRYEILMGRYYAVLGERDKALAARERVADLMQNEDDAPAALAVIDLALGEVERAMELCLQSAERRDPIMFYLQCEPGFDPLRDHPRYPELLEKIGFPGNR